jgi:hypothetical protein
MSKLPVISYTLATVASISFLCGLIIVAGEGSQRV